MVNQIHVKEKFIQDSPTQVLRQTILIHVTLKHSIRVIASVTSITIAIFSLTIAQGGLFI